jgi:O-antigen/teichoic acid export membrane protein
MNDQAPSLRMQAVHGVKWTGTSTISVTILNYARLAILAHLLTAKDFGLMGMVLVIASLGQSFSDMGISNAIIWKQDVTSEQLSTLYWLNIMAGVAVFGIVIAISPLVAAFFHEPRLVNLMFWAAFIFPIAAIGQLFQMLLQKDLLFGRLAKVEIVSASIGAAVSIVAAFYGQGAYSLIWGQLAITACASFLFTFLGWREWRPQFVFRPGKLRGFISFGLYQMGERAVNSFAYNVDYIMVGRFLGPTALGIYMLAWQIMIAPMAKLNPVLTRVAFPVFARKQTDDRALRDGYVELSKMIAILTFPIIVLAAATAPVSVPVIFGPKWNAAIPLIQIFVLLGLLRSLSNPLWSMVLAKGRADIGFALSVSVATISAVAFWFATPHGLHLLAWVEVMVSAVLFIVCLEILRKLIALDYSHYLIEVGRPTLLAAAAGGATYGCYCILRGTISSNLSLFIVLLVFGVLCYALLVALFERKYFLDYLGLLLGKDKAGGTITQQTRIVDSE